MEDFTKMIEAYRWRGGDSNTKKPRDLCASVRASPALATPCNAEEEQAGFTVVCSSSKKDDKGSSSSPNTASLLINRSYREPHNVRSDVHIQTNQFEPRSCVSDDDGVVGSQGTLDKALPYSSGLLKKKSRASSRSRSSRQLVFSSAEDMDAKSDLKGRVKSKVKLKKERKKGRHTHIKQNGAKVSSTQGAIEDYMPEFYDDSACEDGPIKFCSPEVAYSPGDVSQPSHFEVANTPASNKRKRRLAIPTSYVTRHVLMYGKSPFFAHSNQTPKPKNVTKIKKILSNALPEDKTVAVKACTRRRKKVISSKDDGTIEIDKVKELPGHLRESSDQTDAGDQRAYSSKGAVVCLNSGVLPCEATSKAKTSAYFTTIVKALGQRDIVNKTWVPPISVYALIQEELYQDPWKVLVACMLLNKTCGTQMRKVIWDLFALCPTPEAAVAVETDKVEEVIRPLGLQKKRARMIQKFSRDYMGKEWVNVAELHGIGKYATDAYAIFCEGRWREVKPEDHKLVDYWQYLCATDGLGYAFKDDRERSRELATPVSQAES